MSVSSGPRGERSGRPGTHWETELTYVETVVPDRDGDNESPFAWTDTPAPRPNRAARRAAARAARRNQ